MKAAIEKRLASVATALGAQTDRWEIVSFDAETAETADSQVARWLSGEDLPGFPNHIAADRADVNLIIIRGIASPTRADAV
jgi:hypothetical protein